VRRHQNAEDYAQSVLILRNFKGEHQQVLGLLKQRMEKLSKEYLLKRPKN
jgi:hypothetical protein